MRLRDAKQLAESLIEKHIPDRGYTFRFDKSRVTFGRCWYGKRVICLSRQLTLFNNEPHVKDTILHEIAHAIAGRQNGHNRVWKTIAQGLGANPERCYDTKEVVNIPHPFMANCCGIEYHVKNNKSIWKCRKCRKILTLVFNPEYAVRHIELQAAKRAK